MVAIWYPHQRQIHLTYQPHAWFKMYTANIFKIKIMLWSFKVSTVTMETDLLHYHVVCHVLSLEALAL